MSIRTTPCPRPLLVALAAVLSAAGAAGCGSGSEDPIVGCWGYSGGVFQVNPDGTLSTGNDTGTWTNEGGGMYVWTWAAGWVDGITLENGILVEKHLAVPPGTAVPADYTITPTSCTDSGSTSAGSSGGSKCGESGASCSSSADCCGVCNMDSSSSFYLTCE